MREMLAVWSSGADKLLSIFSSPKCKLIHLSDNAGPKFSLHTSMMKHPAGGLFGRARMVHGAPPLNRRMGSSDEVPSYDAHNTLNDCS